MLLFLLSFYFFSSGRGKSSDTDFGGNDKMDCCCGLLFAALSFNVSPIVLHRQGTELQGVLLGLSNCSAQVAGCVRQASAVQVGGPAVTVSG